VASGDLTLDVASGDLTPYKLPRSMQIFHRSTNTISRVSLFGAVFFIGILLWLFYDLEASP
jgi:hypothetical protein